MDKVLDNQKQVQDLMVAEETHEYTMKITTTDYNGLPFINLDAGYYEIVETKYPTGYVGEAENPIFQVKYNNGSVAPEVILVYRSDDDDGHKAGDPINGNATDMVSIADYAIVVGNTPGAALPNTGGPGTRLFMILGSILVAGAGLMMWKKRRIV